MAAELKPGRCKKIDSTWQHEESPSDSTSPLFLSPLALSLSLSQQILPPSHWFQMSSSWPDSPTTWLSSRTDNPPQPLPPISFSLAWYRGGRHVSDRLFLLPAKTHSLIETYQKTHPSSRMKAASSSPTPAYLCSMTNIKLPPVNSLVISQTHCCIILF